MNRQTARAYPKTVRCPDGPVELRPLCAADEAAILAFAGRLPEHDMLFLRRDITQPKVVAAWLKEIAQGTITSLVALRDGAIVGCSALVRDERSWSPHVGELRVVVDGAMRGQGLGRALTQESFAMAIDLGIEKIIAQMTPDQHGAIAVFQSLGFYPEALLRDHVMGRDSVKQDIVILSHDVARFHAKLAAYGVTEAF